MGEEKTAEVVESAVKKAAPNGRLACEEAHRLADELGVSLMEIGRAADRLGIKVVACQLGCF